MSFAGEVKRELARHNTGSYHCRMAEITAILSMCGGIYVSGRDHFSLCMKTENISAARKYFTLLKKTFNIGVDTSVRQHKGKSTSRSYLVGVTDHADTVRVLRAAKLLREDGNSYMDLVEEDVLHDSDLLKKTCCKRAFLRGAFLVTGSITDPNKDYHLEFACPSELRANQIKEILQSFEVEAKIVLRKKHYVVYLKEGDGIVDALNIMEAPQALMELENVRILKDMRNKLNRRVNFEAANITKTVNAAVKQIEDIRYIQETIGFDELKPALADIAEVRLENPHASLSELGMLLTPQVGKSGVNHRLRKLSEIAEDIRANKEEKYYD